MGCGPDIIDPDQYMAVYNMRLEATCMLLHMGSESLFYTFFFHRRLVSCCHCWKSWNVSNGYVIWFLHSTTLRLSLSLPAFSSKFVLLIAWLLNVPVAVGNMKRGPGLLDLGWCRTVYVLIVTELSYFRTSIEGIEYCYGDIFHREHSLMIWPLQYPWRI